MKLVIVRHAERIDSKNKFTKNWHHIVHDWKILDKCANQMTWNPPISLGEENKAQETGVSLKKLYPYQKFTVFCSPALRCQQTAEAICSILNCKFSIVQGLYELFSIHGKIGQDAIEKQKFKQNEPLPWLTSEQCFEAGLEHVNIDFEDFSDPPLCGETQEYSDERCFQTLLQIVKKIEDEKTEEIVILIGHQFTHRFYLASICDTYFKEIENLFQDFKNFNFDSYVKNLAMTTLNVDKIQNEENKDNFEWTCIDHCFSELEQSLHNLLNQ